MKFNHRTRPHDKDKFFERAKVEAEKIYNKESTRLGRTYSKVVQDTLYGHAAEQYLIDEHSFKDDERDFKDLFDPVTGESVEVKVTSKIGYVDSVLERCRSSYHRVNSYNKIPYSKKLYIFIGDRNTTEYELYNEYKWHNERQQFCLHKRQNVL